MTKLLTARLIVEASLFSCELLGSMASLLGTGVMFSRGCLFLARVLDLVVSLRHGEEFGSEERVGSFEDAEGVPDLAKKPKILACLPVEAAGVAFFAGVGFAGVRAVALVPAMTASFQGVSSDLGSVYMYNKRAVECVFLLVEESGSNERLKTKAYGGLYPVLGGRQ